MGLYECMKVQVDLYLYLHDEWKTIDTSGKVFLTVLEWSIFHVHLFCSAWINKFSYSSVWSCLSLIPCLPYYLCKQHWIWKGLLRIILRFMITRSPHATRFLSWSVSKILSVFLVSVSNMNRRKSRLVLPLVSLRLRMDFWRFSSFPFSALLKCNLIYFISHVIDF